MDWHPIEEMPEELKDGRRVLLRYKWGHARDPFIIEGKWSSRLNEWVTVGAVQTAIRVTHYCEIQPPEDGE